MEGDDLKQSHAEEEAGSEVGAMVPKKVSNEHRGFGLGQLAVTVGGSRAVELKNGASIGGRKVRTMQWAPLQQCRPKANQEVRPDDITETKNKAEEITKNKESKEQSKDTKLAKSEVIEGEEELQRTIFIKNLPKEVDKEEVKQCFSAFGEVQSFFLVLDHVTKRPKGSGLLKFKTLGGADAALLAADCVPGVGIILKDRQLKLCRALDKKTAHNKEQLNANKEVQDHRNLYLAKGTPASKGVSVSDPLKCQGPMCMDLYFTLANPPLVIFVTAEFACVPLSINSCLPAGATPIATCGDANEDVIEGTDDILRHIGRLANFPYFYRQDNKKISSLIDRWIAYAPLPASSPEFEGVCSYINESLRSQTCLAGMFSSIADIVIWWDLTESGQRWKRLRKKSKKFPYLVSWYNSYTMRFDTVLSRVTSAYLAQWYQGEVIVCFDDTNPAIEINKFVENLVVDIGTLGLTKKSVTYTSVYFSNLMKMAEKLILEGKAYVDDTQCEQMQKERMDGIGSNCRTNSPKENMKLWKEMISGSERGLQCCVRGKLDIQDPNKFIGDPVYYRCNPMSHYRIGPKYKVYPTCDFACPFIDSVEGITHALRSSEYIGRNAQYYDRIQEDMGLRKVNLCEFSRLNMAKTVHSERKLLLFVPNGKVTGWDDPRFPTVEGVVRRGLQIEALMQFILEQGASKNLHLMEWDKLWAINKNIIDRRCPRHTAVTEEGRVLLTLVDGPDKPFECIIPKHKKYYGAGDKATTFTKQIWIDRADGARVLLDEEITLMDWGNAIVYDIKRDENRNVKQLFGVLHLEGSDEMTRLKLTWLPNISELVNLSLMEFDYSITKKKLEGEDFVDVGNACTVKETAALGDSNMKNLQRGDVLQLERKGYFRCEVPFIMPSKPIVLFAIPEGGRP